MSRRAARIDRLLPYMAAALCMPAAIALWVIAAHATRDDAAWMVVPVAASAVVAVRAMGWPQAWHRMLGTLALLVAVTLSARWLQVAALHVRLLGLSWEAAITSLDPAFVWAVVRARSGTAEWVLHGLAVVAALAWARRAPAAGAR